MRTGVFAYQCKFCVLMIFVLPLIFSQEKVALLTSELDSLRESTIHSVGAPGEASSLSFELTEADL